MVRLMWTTLREKINPLEEEAKLEVEGGLTFFKVIHHTRQNRPTQRALLYYGDEKGRR